jgi:23S rRNA G2445 N2-methylase RlmL
MARPADFDLRKELTKPSFTPAQRDAPALVDLIVIGDEPVVARATPALAGLGASGSAAIAARFDSVDDGAKARLVAALGQLARKHDAEARAMVLARIGDPSSRVRRAAAVALGKLGGDDARAALITRWDAGDVAPDEQRALAEALGKVGGDEAMQRLAALAPGADKELARRRDRALLMADRDAKRGEDSTIATDVPPPRPLTVRLGCRQGLGTLLVKELQTLRVNPLHRWDAGVDVELTTPWSTLFASRLWASAAIRFPLVGLEASYDTDAARASGLTAAIVRVMTSSDVLGLLRAWTRGAIRWRLGMERGHQRAVIWRVAREVTELAPDLINDPTQTTWDVTVDDQARTLELTARRAADPRFAYRLAEVPAASHPTVAAAIAWLAEVRDDDRVWDPFCGSGVELVERARRGAYRSLLGTDLDEGALAATRTNLEAAGVTAELAIADARTHAPGPVDLIVTNPPLGGRIRGDAIGLLCTALPNFVGQLAPRGRLVWITPQTRKTSPVAAQLGLELERSLPVDLGGVRGHLERWNKR